MKWSRSKRVAFGVKLVVHKRKISCRVKDSIGRSGMVEANRWIAERRSVAADYLRAYGAPARQVKGLRLQINSRQTGSAAESYFADLVFRNIGQQ